MQDYSALIHRADELIEEKQYGEALQLLNQAFQLRPDEPQPLVVMASVFKELGDADGAIGLLRKASEIGPPNAYVLLELGIGLYRQNRLGEAETALEEAVTTIQRGVAAVRQELDENTPENGEALRLQCDELEVTAEQATELLRVIRNSAGQTPDVQGGPTSDVQGTSPKVGVSNDGSTAGAVSASESAPGRPTELAKSAGPTASQLLAQAAAHLQKGDAKQALACYERVLALDENSLPARLNISTILFSEGRRQEALAHVKEGRELLENHKSRLSKGMPLDDESRALANDVQLLLDRANQMHNQIQLRLMFAESAENRIDPVQVKDHLQLLESGKPVRIGVLITLWKRHALAEMVLARCRAIKDRIAPLVELELLAVGSEGAVTRSLAERNGFDYLEQPNDPLGAKRNAGLRALKDRNLDAVAFVDSDDFVDDQLFKTYAVGTRAGYAVLGLLDMHVLDLANLRACYWPGYGTKGGRQGETIGLGRCINRALLDRLGWKLWDDSLNRCLDGSMMDHIAGPLVADPKRYPVGSISSLEHDITAVDVKTETNLWSFEQMVSALEDARYVPPMELIGKTFDDEEAGRLLSMSDAAERISSLVSVAGDLDGLAA